MPPNCARGGECNVAFGTANGFSAASGGPCGPCVGRSSTGGDLTDGDLIECCIGGAGPRRFGGT